MTDKTHCNNQTHGLRFMGCPQSYCWVANNDQKSPLIVKNYHSYLPELNKCLSFVFLKKNTGPRFKYYLLVLSLAVSPQTTFLSKEWRDMATFTILLKQSPNYHVLKQRKQVCYLFSTLGSKDGVPPFGARSAVLTTKGCYLVKAL